MLHFLTSTTLDFDFITEGLGIDAENGFIDYVISSYTVDMRIIRDRFWTPQLQLHCGKIINGRISTDFWVHEHIIQDGIYHAKFILVTTKNVLRFIFTTANMTYPMINGTCWNDYLRITIPYTGTPRQTDHTRTLKQFFKWYGIKTIANIEEYDWQCLRLRFVTSIPTVTSHTVQMQHMSNTFVSTTAVTASIVSDFNLSRYIHTGPVLVYRPRREFPEDKTAQCFMISIKPGCTHYTFGYVENVRKYHVKRYIFNTDGDRYMLVTSANLTSSAWNAKNAELGILFRCRADYQIGFALDK